MIVIYMARYVNYSHILKKMIGEINYGNLIVYYS